MEDWVKAIKNKLLDDQIELPPDDWELFEARYLAPKRRRWTIPLGVVLVSAAAAAVALVIINKPAKDTLYKQIPSSPVTGAHFSGAPLLASGTSIIIQENQPIKKIKNPSTPVSLSTQEPKPDAGDAIIESEPSESDQELVSQTKEKENESPENDYHNYDTSSQKNRQRLTLAPHIGGLRSDASTGMPSSAFTDSKRIALYPEMLFRRHLSYISGGYNDIVMTANHSIPVTIGLDVGLSITPRLSVVSGAELSIYKSKFIGTIMDRTATQKVCYLGIPLRMEWAVWNNGRFSAWFGAGGKVDRLIYGKFGNEKLTDKTFNWSAVAEAGLGYDILENVGLYLAPELSWYFKPDNPAILTYRTENPLMVSVNAGLIFKF